MKKNDVLVTVIVPIYNVEKYVAKCLDSLLSQTFHDIEIYAVIDGSPDNSIGIVKEYCKKDKRIKCIDKENGGYGSVLEYAIRNLKSQYFIICDPDDWLADDAIEILYNQAIQHNADIVVGDKYIVYSDNEECDYESSTDLTFKVDANVLYTGEEVGKLALLSVSPHSKLFKTSLATKIDFPRKVSYTDFVLYLVSLSNAKRGIYINQALSYYLIDRQGNTATDVSLKAAKAQLAVFQATMEQLKNNKCKNVYIYCRMYNQFRYIILDVMSKLSDDNLKIIYDDLNDSFILLKPYKRYIIDKFSISNPVKNIYNKMLCKCLFDDKTRDSTIKFIIKCLRKRGK